MKKLVLAFGIILASVFSINAQNAAASGSQSDKMVNKLTTACQLTPDQVTKVRPLVDSFLKTRAENKQKYASDAEGLKTANKANRENFKSQLSALLSADQKEKFKEYQKEQQEKKAANKEEGNE
jgi:hypothetical protein